MNTPQEITLKCIVSEHDSFSDVVCCDFLTVAGKRLRGFGIPNPCIMPIEIIDFCGINRSNAMPSEEISLDVYEVRVDPTPMIYCKNTAIASFQTEEEANIACRALNISRVKTLEKRSVFRKK